MLIFYKSFADLISKANSARDRLGAVKIGPKWGLGSGVDAWGSEWNGGSIRGRGCCSARRATWSNVQVSGCHWPLVRARVGSRLELYVCAGVSVSV